MSRSQQHAPISAFDFSGGLNSAFSKTLLAENELIDCENYHLDARGGLYKRAGYDEHLLGDSATGNAITGIWQHRTATSSAVLRIQGTRVDESSGGTWVNRTGSEIVTPGQNNRWVFQTFRASSIFTNGVDIPLKWSSGNVAKIARAIAAGADTIDKAGTLVRHRERIVLGDVTATEASVQTRYESVIWPSQAGTLDTWDAAPTGKIHIDQGDGDSITCLLDVGGFLVVFKQHSLHRVNDLGAAGVQDRLRIASVGTPGPHTAIVADDLVYFIDTLGRFWVYDVRQGDTPDALRELSRNKLGPTTLNAFVRDRLRYAHLFHDSDRNEIVFFMPQESSAQTNVAWVYNISTGGFTRDRWDVNWNVSTRYLDDDLNAVLLAGSFDGLVCELYTGLTDNGKRIIPEAVTRPFNMGDMSVIKGLRWFDFYANAETAQDVGVTALFDFSASGPMYSVPVRTPFDTLT